jgi:hypothetical protein
MVGVVLKLFMEIIHVKPVVGLEKYEKVNN